MVGDPELVPEYLFVGTRNITIPEPPFPPAEVSPLEPPPPPPVFAVAACPA